MHRRYQSWSTTVRGPSAPGFVQTPDVLEAQLASSPTPRRAATKAFMTLRATLAGSGRGGHWTFVP